MSQAVKKGVRLSGVIVLALVSLVVLVTLLTRLPLLLAEPSQAAANR